MKRVRNGLLRLVVLTGSALTAGCLPGHAPTTEDLAEAIHKDMRSISEAVHSYKVEHGSLPEGDFWKVRSALVLGGHIKDFPTPPAAIFSRNPVDYRIDAQYDTMDAGPDSDAAIAVWGLRDAVCVEYNRRYASDTLGPSVYDWQGRGKQYPGEVIGTHIQTYAIKWTSDAVDDCEIEWVVEYR